MIYQENREIPYLRSILQVVTQYATLDETAVYTTGFSLNSMFAAYAAFCFQQGYAGGGAARVAGVWQGGSGLKLTGQLPNLPANEGECTQSSQQHLDVGMEWKFAN